MLAELNVKQKFEIESLVSFVREWKLEKVFEKLYGCKIDDWDNPEPDEDVILKLIESYVAGYWIVEYHEDGNGYFILKEIDINNPITKKGKLKTDTFVFR